MEARFRTPKNPLEWVAAILILGVIVALGILLSAFVIVAVAVTLVAAPLVAWWRRRQPPTVAPADEAAELDDEGPIVEAEFEVKRED